MHFKWSTIWKEEEWGKKTLTQVKFYYYLKKMRYNSHTVICILIKHTIQWIFVYSQSCATNTTISNSRTHPVLEMSHPLKGTPFSSPPQPFAATNLLLISMDLPILDISHKQNSILCMFSFLSWCFQNSSMSQYVSILHSFLMAQ